MSQSSAARHDHAAADLDHAGHTPPHPHHSRRAHWIGSALSIVLTVIPFWLVMARVLPSPTLTAVLIFTLALAQIVVHVICFLHLDTKSESGWTLLAFLFTTVIVVLVVGGSIWVMLHLNSNMMPTPDGSMPAVR